MERKCQPERIRLHDERTSITHHFSIPDGDAGSMKDFYITCGMYPDGTLGEVFITADKEGSFVRASLEITATFISLGLQHGIPIDAFIAKLEYVRFEPAGMAEGTPIELAPRGSLMVTSVFDYIAKYLRWKFPGGRIKE